MGCSIFFKIDIKTGIKNLFSPIPEVDITVTTPQEDTNIEEEEDNT